MPWLRREDLEDAELHGLSPWAAHSRDHGGRRLPEPDDPMRTAFLRDRDRVIHSTAFRRMQHKTQVLAAFEGDHYRSRMTHSLEVSQTARGVARALRLNQDLAEVIALGHDLGHPPFGHKGEETLHRLMADHGGFRHNCQGVRIVDLLEDRHGTGMGLNLTLAVRRSLLKGAIPDGFPLSGDLPGDGAMPLEHQIVDRCDRITYLCHDLDDGLRAGLVQEGEAAELALWRAARERVADDRRSRIISDVMAILIQDLVDSAENSLNEGPSREIRPGAAPPRLDHSGAVRVQAEELLRFLRERFYESDPVVAAMGRGCTAIAARFHHYVRHPDDLPQRHRARAPRHGIERTVCDYIAGMTDRFLVTG